jgi:pSer/pThr/pTyr-binding forkhead associated (FHA) protein
MIWVVLTVDGAVVKEVPVDRDLVIGRIGSADLRIASTEVSSRHARLSPKGDGAVLTDLGSTNGTFLNGEKKVDPNVEVPLTPGVRVCIGPGVLEVKAGAAPKKGGGDEDDEKKLLGTMVIGTDDTASGLVNEAKFRAAKPRIVVAHENDRRIVPLETPAVEIGREGTPIAINHPSISGRHAKISFDNGFFVLRDLQSRNGTFLDGLPVTSPAPLGTQTAITFGTVDCLFVQEPPQGTAAGEVAPELIVGHVVNLGKATQHQGQMILEEHAKSGKTLGEIFVEKGILPPKEWSEIFRQRKLIGTLAPKGRGGMHPAVWLLIGLGIAAVGVWAFLTFFSKK